MSDSNSNFYYQQYQQQQQQQAYDSQQQAPPSRAIRHESPSSNHNNNVNNNYYYNANNNNNSSEGNNHHYVSANQLAAQTGYKQSYEVAAAAAATAAANSGRLEAKMRTNDIFDLPNHNKYQADWQHERQLMRQFEQTGAMAGSKQAYKQALDRQVAEKEQTRLSQERARRQNDLDEMVLYPFGRRAYSRPPQQQQPQPQFFQEASYTSSSSSLNHRSRRPRGGGGGGVESESPPLPLPVPSQYRLNKSNIVEKANSLSDDIPPYDPIKTRTSPLPTTSNSTSNNNNNANNSSNKNVADTYDPWGKPGAGAPLIDKNTGHKFTKYSGQLWSDTIGGVTLLADRQRAAIMNGNVAGNQTQSAAASGGVATVAGVGRFRPLTLEEQKNEMEMERERRRQAQALYKENTGDLATWIAELERRVEPPYGAANNARARAQLDENARRYHSELGMQQEERYRLEKLDKLKDQVAGVEHAKNWSEWVGVRSFALLTVCVDRDVSNDWDIVWW